MLTSLLLVLIGGADGGTPAVPMATLTVQQGAFDGRSYKALLLVCSEGSTFFIDSELSDETFHVEGVYDCQAKKELPWMTTDIVERPQRLLRISPSMCVGKRFEFSLFPHGRPSHSGCVELELSAWLLSSKGAGAGIVKTRVTVSP